MKAMILAAGRGERMRPLTDEIPKPLLRVGGKPLIEWNIERMKSLGCLDIIINTGWLGAQLPAALGNGERFGLRLNYSHEPPDALGTGGGVFQALSELGSQPFFVVNGDVWFDHPLDDWSLPSDVRAKILLVKNPSYHPRGDFSLDNALVRNSPRNLTFAGIGLYHPSLFSACSPGRFELAPLLREAAEQEQLLGEKNTGNWFNVGTPAVLQELDEFLATG